MLLFVLSEADPVAQGVAALWGTPPATGTHVGGAAVRELAPGRLVLRRAVRHIDDSRLSGELRTAFPDSEPTVVFPSIHWSEGGPLCFTVHPLGNPTARAEVGGEPQRLTPTDPSVMAAALRGLQEMAGRFSLPATFEATHHGPWLDRPALFVEIGGGPASERPDPAQIAAIAQVLRELEPSSGDRVALGVGGGHYAPHFTELTLARRWAFGHLLSRHVLADLSRSVAEAAVAGTPGCEGAIFARAADSADAVWSGLVPRLRDATAPRRVPPTRGPSPSAGT
ncbi:MAG TPA: D-aminoacyl-tRNA deacylase [Thermoplasmata archaeon]|nr:D-aminoacyl-tRNA deacylase [Thermoplasmata archaeon]